MMKWDFSEERRKEKETALHFDGSLSLLTTYLLPISPSRVLLRVCRYALNCFFRIFLFYCCGQEKKQKEGRIGRYIEKKQ